MSDKYLDELTKEMSRGVAADLFEHEMFTNSKTLGRETQLEVIIGGDKAMTDGKRVVLPALDKGKVVSAHAANVARGFVNHEAAHLRFSNGHTVKRFSKHEKHMAFLNGMEDARIEQLFSQHYPGSQLQFTEAANATLKRFLQQVDRGEIKVADRSQLVPMAVAWNGRAKMGQAIDKKLLERLNDMVGADNMKVVDMLANKALDATGTLDIARFLEKWLGKVDPETEDERNKDKEGGGHGAGDGSGGADGDGDGMAGIGGDAGPEWSPSSSSGFFDPDMADAVQAALPTGERRGAYTSRMDEDVVWERFEDFMKNTTKGGACDEGFAKYPTDDAIKEHVPHMADRPLLAQTMFRPRREEDLRRLGLANVEYMRSHLGPAVRGVKMALERGLIVAKQRDWDPGQTRGLLDPKRLATVMTGSRNFYRVRRPLEMVDTAVTLLIDMSGSMNGQKAVEAMKAAFIFAESLTKVGVPIEVLGFTSDRKVASHGYSRAGIIDIPVFKSFRESMSASMWKVALASNATQSRAGGNNADGDSLLHAWQRLRKRPEPRKVLIVFSDGQPCTSGHGNEHEHLKRVVNMLTVQGCECVGIGIMDHSVQNYYPEHIVIRKADELAEKAGGFLRMLLVPNAKKVRKARAELKKAAA